MLLVYYINLGGGYVQRISSPKLNLHLWRISEEKGGDNQSQMLGAWIQGIDHSWLASLKNPAPFFFKTSGYTTS